MVLPVQFINNLLHLWNHMGGGDETNGGNALAQYFYDLLDYLLQRLFPGRKGTGVAADLVVLAIGALQVAMGKKNITNTLHAANGRLFTPVDTNGGDCQPKVRAAET